MDLIRRLRTPKKEENGTESPPDHLKLAVDVNFVGTDGCGKTTILMAGALGQRPEHSPPATLTWESYSGWLPGPLYNVHFNIWDTPGADGTDRIRAIGYRHNVSKSDIAVILFNIGGSIEDIENLDMEILPEVDDYCPGAAKLLVGCRLDLRKSPTRFDPHHAPPATLQDGINAAKRIGAWGYVECSGKTNDGVSELLVVLAQMAVVIKTHAKWKLSKPSMPFFVVSPDAAPPVPDPFEVWHRYRDIYNSARSQNSAVINDAKRPNNLVSEDNDRASIIRPNNIANSDLPRPMNVVSQDDDTIPRRNNISSPFGATDSDMPPPANNLVSDDYDTPRPRNIADWAA